MPDLRLGGSLLAGFTKRRSRCAARAARRRIRCDCIAGPRLRPRQRHRGDQDDQAEQGRGVLEKCRATQRAGRNPSGASTTLFAAGDSARADIVLGHGVQRRRLRRRLGLAASYAGQIPDHGNGLRKLMGMTGPGKGGLGGGLAGGVSSGRLNRV